MNIGVYGSAGGDVGKAIERAKIIGGEIAKKGHVLISGGCLGLPYEATLAAFENGGETIGFSPGINLTDHVDRFNFPEHGFTSFSFVPQNYEYVKIKSMCLKYRNLRSVDASDAAILISGRIGTLNEFTLAYDSGKVIGIMPGSGGISEEIPKIVELANKKTPAILIYEDNPKLLVEKVIDSFENR